MHAAILDIVASKFMGRSTRLDDEHQLATTWAGHDGYSFIRTRSNGFSESTMSQSDRMRQSTTDLATANKRAENQSFALVRGNGPAAAALGVVRR